MAYRKFRADYLFDGRNEVGGDSVLILTHDGVVQGIVPAAEAGEGIERYPGLLSPGFINCHCHLELSHLKGRIPERTGLVDFLLAVIGGRGNDRPESVSAAIAAAEQEMAANGIVAVGDICNSTDTLQRKKEGRLAYYNFIEAVGFIGKTAPDRFTAALAVFEAFQNGLGGKNSVVPHAPYSVSAALFGLIARFAGGRTLTMHSQETPAENEFYQTGQGDFLRLYRVLGLDTHDPSFFHGSGKRSLATVLEHFPRDQRLILVHNVDTGAGDLAQTRDWSDLYFCLCPNANLYIGGVLPPLDTLLSHGCRIVIGTDSLASNHRLSILAELITLQLAFPALETSRLLEWATSAGAAALGMESDLGSFTPGLRPGVLLLQGLDAGGRLTAKASVRKLL